jgi:hypothetical protein
LKEPTPLPYLTQQEPSALNIDLQVTLKRKKDFSFSITNKNIFFFQQINLQKNIQFVNQI